MNKNKTYEIDVFKWQHKKTKKIVKVVPWFEVLKDDTILKGKIEKRTYKIGCLTQIGWLLENEHGIFLGVGPKASKEFKNLGEWKVDQK